MRRVVLLPGKPSYIPEIKARGRSAAGLKFEREAERHLASVPGVTLIANPWFEYVDNFGKRGVCSPDFVVTAGARTLVGECKLTAGRGSYGKLLSLYLPLARAFYGPETSAFGVARNVAASGNAVFFTFPELLPAPELPLRLLILP